MRILVVLALVLGGIVSPARAQLEVSEAIARASSQNLDLQAAVRRLEVDRAGLVIAGGRPNPRLALDYPLGGLAQTKKSIFVEQPLEVGGQRDARLTVAERQLELAQVQTGLLAWQIRGQTQQAFYELVAAENLSRQVERATCLADELTALADKRFQAGDVAEADVKRARLEANVVRQRLITTRNAEDQARLRLTGLFGRSEPGRLEIVHPPWPTRRPDLDELWRQALQYRLELGVIDCQIALGASRAELADANSTPGLSMAGGFYSDGLTGATTWQVGARLTIPWGYDGTGDIQQARAEEEAARANRAAAENRIKVEVAQALAGYLAARDTVDRDLDLLGPEADEVLLLATRIYQYGKGDLFQALQAQQRVLAQQEQLVLDQAALLKAANLLETAVGCPLELAARP